MNATYEDWRKSVEAELKGKTLDEALFVEPVALPRPTTTQALRIVMRGGGQADLDAGADALWDEREEAISTLAEHEAGASAATEIACALLKGLDQPTALIRVAVGRETFTELCKLRALRICWQKLHVLKKVSAPIRIHAVASSLTLTQRDPWVNMLRVTTQAFAAMLGGADDFTPMPFDDSALAHRVARNTGLILRDESMLTQVMDPAGGSYFFDALTNKLAREAWKLFQDPSKLDIAAEARERADRIAKRKLPILGVSEFANLDETLPAKPGAPRGDAAPFEALRLRADVVKPEVLLLDLGSKPRVGFATSFFTAGGFRTRETTQEEKATIVCLCGTDEQYAAQGAAIAARLKALGVSRVVLAGKVATAGVDELIFLGSDAVQTLGKLLDAYQ